MTISTSNYEFTHGRKPRGKGSWAFQFFIGRTDTIEFAPRVDVRPMSYRDAKAWAIRHAKAIGADRVAVAT